MGNKFTRPSKDAIRQRVELVTPLLRAGASQVDVIRATGVSQQWLSSWVRRMRARPDEAPTGLAARDARGREQLEARRRAAMEAYALGMTQAAIARRWGVSRVSVLRWVRAYEAGGARALTRARQMGKRPQKKRR